MTAKRLVLTGLGVVSPFGAGTTLFRKGLRNGRPAFAAVPGITAGPAAAIDAFEPAKILGKGLRTLDRTSLLVLSAIGIDLAHTLPTLDHHQLALILGTAFGSLRAIAEFDRSRLTEGALAVDPGRFPNTVINAPASQANIRFGITGMSATVTTGLSAAIDALAYARSALRWGRVKAAIVGGADELCEELSLGFERSGYASPRRLCQPLGGEADGLLAGEGAAMFLLEEEQDAQAAGRTPLATLAGLGQRCAPACLGGPEQAQALTEAIDEALAEAGAAADDVDLVVSGANGVAALDAVEAAVLSRRLLARAPHVYAPKALMGEAWGGSSALQLAAAVVALEEQFIPPTPVAPLRPDLLLPVAAAATPAHLATVLVTSTDFHGYTAAAVLRRPE